jgi:hypothetical protein
MEHDPDWYDSAIDVDSDNDEDDDEYVMIAVLCCMQLTNGAGPPLPLMMHTAKQWTDTNGSILRCIRDYTRGLLIWYAYFFPLINFAETVQDERCRQGTFPAPESILFNI